MKILYLIDTLEVGGAEKSLLEILSCFDHIEPLICHIYPGQSLKSTYLQAGIAVISLDVPGNYSFGQAIRRVKAVAQNEQVDLIHTTLFRADIVGRSVGQLLGIPVVGSFVNESYAPVRWQTLSLPHRLKLYGVRWLDAQSARWTQHFAANSETVKATNAQSLNIPLDKISVIYRGRNPQPFLSADSQQLAATRAGLGLMESDQIILNVARLLDRKGQADLIRAMPHVLRVLPQVRLVIAGDGVYRPQLEALIQELGLEGVVSLLGQRSDVPALLHIADLFVFPSYFEGYPGALVEAMFAAKPIVASNIPVHQEAIVSGVTGRLVPIQDATAMAQAIIWMFKHPSKAREMSEQARRVAMERFHIEKIASQYEALYQQVRQAAAGNSNRFSSLHQKKA
ncbi:MAG: glycosyltransferase [Anaerolineae bacterium]|nr:glycosyltransferase [Anaerolineae bacterium]